MVGGAWAQGMVQGGLGVQEELGGQKVARVLPRPADLLTGSLHVCVCWLFCSVSVTFSSPGTSTPPAIAATPVSAIPAALGVSGYSPVPTQPTGQPAPDALYPNGVHPYPGGVLCCPLLSQQPSSHHSPCTSRLRAGGCTAFSCSVTWAGMFFPLLARGAETHRGRGTCPGLHSQLDRSLANARPCACLPSHLIPEPTGGSPPHLPASALTVGAALPSPESRGPGGPPAAGLCRDAALYR